MESLPQEHNLLPPDFSAQSSLTGLTPPTNGSEQKSRGYLKIVITAAIVLILAGGGYFAYAKYSPQATLKAFVNGLGAAQGTSPKHFALALKYTDSLNSLVTMNLAGDAQSQGLNLNQQTADINFKLAADVKSSDTSSGSLSSDTNFNIDNLELRLTNGVFYADISKLPLIGGLAAADNGWVKLDLNNLPPQYKTQFDMQFQSSQLAEAQQNYKNFINGLEQNKIISGNFVGVENFGNGTAYHYKIEIDKQALAQYIVEKVSTLVPGGAAAINKNAVASVQSALDQANLKDIEIWIGVSDHELHKLVFDVGATLPAALGNAPSAGQSSDFSGEYDLSNLAALNVMPPSQALDLLPYLTGQQKFQLQPDLAPGSPQP